VAAEVNEMSLQTEERSTTTPDRAAASDPAYEKARERAKALQGLYVHLFVFALVNGALFLINWAARGRTATGGSTGRCWAGAWRPSSTWPRRYFRCSPPSGWNGARSAWPADGPSAADPDPRRQPQGGQDAGGSGRPCGHQGQAPG
jgi:hypothetical protein